MTTLKHRVHIAKCADCKRWMTQDDKILDLLEEALAQLQKSQPVPGGLTAQTCKKIRRLLQAL